MAAGVRASAGDRGRGSRGARPSGRGGTAVTPWWFRAAPVILLLLFFSAPIGASEVDDVDALLALVAELEARVAALEARHSWRGIELAEEDRCSPYDRGDYRWRGPVAAIRQELLERDGGADLYAGAPAAGRLDVDHVVAVSEAHDSGLCARETADRREFANWRRNLVATSASINRSKGGRDAAEWRPEHGRCWWARTNVETRRFWGLTIDAAEAAALDEVLAECE